MNNLLRRLTLIAFIVFPTISFCRSPKIAADLEDIDQQSAVNVIVQFNAPRTDQDLSDIDRLGGRSQASDLTLINGAAYSLPAKALAALAGNPNVRYVSPDREIRPMLDYAAAAMGADIASLCGWTGAGIGVAVIDSGIFPEKNLFLQSGRGSRIVYSQSFVPNVTSTTDDYGHGTHVSGIVAGDGAASIGPPYFKTFRGIAPQANLINLRVLDANGMGSDSAVIAAINTAIQLKNIYNIRVINLSLGRPVYESYALDPLCQAVEKAWQSGIVVVVAAGNGGRDQSQGTNGYATITAPGNDPLVITVGAMKTMGTIIRADDLIATYSSKGPTLIDHVVKPDLVAPGNQIISLEAPHSTILSSSTTNLIPYSYYMYSPLSGNSTSYFRLSGTSMATPMVSGAVALMLGKNPNLSPDTVKARLMKTASKNFPSFSSATDPVTGITYTDQYDIFTIGAGYVDVLKALNVPDVLPTGTTAASPVAVYQAATSSVTLVNASTAIWGTHAVWGTSSVWGAATVWGNSVFVDGQAALFGTSAIWGSTAIWGTAAAQGSSTIWGMHAVWGTSTNDDTESLGVQVTGED